MKGYVYILECADGSYYTGSTKDIVQRIREIKKIFVVWWTSQNT